MYIDERGGDAAGYVSVTDNEIRHHRKPGCWIGARERFIKRAAEGHTCIMHARYATCGKKAITEAHPFAIRRNGRVKLWGCHNGVISNAWESARRRNRHIEVDSEELFELIADGESLSHLHGYGVISWIEADNPRNVYLCRISDHSDLFVVKTTEGGYIWGSTKTIVEDSAYLADIDIECQLDLSEVGRVYRACRDGIYLTKRPFLKLSTSGYYWNYAAEDDNEENWNKYWADMWDEEQKEKRKNPHDDELASSDDRVFMTNSEREDWKRWTDADEDDRDEWRDLLLKGNY